MSNMRLAKAIFRAVNWLKNLAPLSQPIRSKTKTNRDLLALVFLHLSLALSSNWFIGLSASAVIGHTDYFGFGFTTQLKTDLRVKSL